MTPEEVISVFRVERRDAMSRVEWIEWEVRLANWPLPLSLHDAEEFAIRAAERLRVAVRSACRQAVQEALSHGLPGCPVPQERLTEIRGIVDARRTNLAANPTGTGIGENRLQEVLDLLALIDWQAAHLRHMGQGPEGDDYRRGYAEGFARAKSECVRVADREAKLFENGSARAGSPGAAARRVVAAIRPVGVLP